MKSLVTEFFGTVVGRHQTIEICEDDYRYSGSEIFCVDLTSYRPLTYAPLTGSHKGDRIKLSQPARIAFSSYDYNDPDSNNDEMQKVLNNMSVGTEIAFQVQDGNVENVNGIDTEVGHRITSIKIVGNHRMDLGEYLFAFHKKQGYI